MAPKKRKAKAPAAAAPEPAPAPAESRGDDLWPATPLEGEAFDTLCEMLSSGGFWARLSDGEPDDGREAAKFVRGFTGCDGSTRCTRFKTTCA